MEMTKIENVTVRTAKYFAFLERSLGPDSNEATAELLVVADQWIDKNRDKIVVSTSVQAWVKIVNGELVDDGKVSLLIHFKYR